jgi:hypothetical protein
MPRRSKCQNLLLRFTPIHPGLIVICLRSDVKNEKGDGCDAPSMLLIEGTRPHDSTELFYWSAATISLIMCQSRALFSFVVLNFQSACGYAKFISKFILKRKKEGFFFPTMFNNYLYVSWTLC